MKNSELSSRSSSENAFIVHPLDGIYPNAWDESPDESSRHDLRLYTDSYSPPPTEVECPGVAMDSYLFGSQAGEGQTGTEIGTQDSGVWLLRNSLIRRDQWTRLRNGTCNVEAPPKSMRYSSGTLKRCCDIAGSLFLMVALLPLFILIAIMIKLDSPGRIFFCHDRVGKDGKRFVLWKFRSMKMDSPKYEVSPRTAVDGRLTRVGRWIRRLSLDEIPQLINVLRGEMSLVGPRPEMPFIVDRYRPIERERLVARPGITGLWQISPARAYPIHENLHYDLHYIHNQNFLLDCVIILRTLTAIVHGVGAV